MANFYTSNVTTPVSGPPDSSGDSLCLDLPSGLTFNTTTSGTAPLDTAGDCLFFHEAPDGAVLHAMHLFTDDADTGSSLDMDVILRIPDEDGDAVSGVADVVLWDAGAAFQAEVDKVLHFHNQFVNAKLAWNRLGLIGFKVVTAAGTGVAAASLKAVHWYT